MQAHRIKVVVSTDHQLTVTLPESFPTGEAEVIVLAGGATRLGHERGVGESPPKLKVDDFLSSRIKLPAGVGPLSLEDMERATMESQP